MTRKQKDLMRVGIVPCDCGKPSVRMKCGREYECQRCHDLEGMTSAQEIRRRGTVTGGLKKWDEPTQRQAYMAMMPQWIQDWYQQQGQSSDIMLTRIESWIDDLGSCLVVHGHGEYRLELGLPQPDVCDISVITENTGAYG